MAILFSERVAIYFTSVTSEITETSSENVQPHFVNSVFYEIGVKILCLLDICSLGFLHEIRLLRKTIARFFRPP